MIRAIVVAASAFGTAWMAALAILRARRRRIGGVAAAAIGSRAMVQLAADLGGYLTMNVHLDVFHIGVSKSRLLRRLPGAICARCALHWACICRGVATCS